MEGQFIILDKGCGLDMRHGKWHHVAIGLNRACRVKLPVSSSLEKVHEINAFAKPVSEWHVGSCPHRASRVNCQSPQPTSNPFGIFSQRKALEPTAPSFAQSQLL